MNIKPGIKLNIKPGITLRSYSLREGPTAEADGAAERSWDGLTSSPIPHPCALLSVGRGGTDVGVLTGKRASSPRPYMKTLYLLKVQLSSTRQHGEKQCGHL